MLQNIRIVLVNTSHTGNIGSAARAMKTMGLEQLVLVDPVSAPDGKSVALAAGAGDVLGKARIVETLDDAIADCGLVLGTSHFCREKTWPVLGPREVGERVLTEAANYPVALVFGRENNGLSNDELKKCHFHITIPANPDYSSLNLAAAVQTLCYEIRMTFLQGVTTQNDALDYPRGAELELFYQHLQQTLDKTGFIKPQHPGAVMDKLRRLFNRARPDAQELNILRGILTSVMKSVKED